MVSESALELFVDSALLRGLRFDLRPGERWLVGRGEDCDILLPHRSVSRHHAALTWRDDRVHVEDLDSRNGVLVDGQRVAHVALAAGDVVRIGDVALRVRERGTGPRLVHIGRARSTVGVAAVAVGARSEVKLQVLLEAANELHRADDLDSASRRIVELAARVLEADRVVLILSSGDGDRSVAAAYPAGGPPTFSQHVVDHVLAHDAAVLYDDALDDLGHAASVVAEGILCTIAAPLAGRTRTLGVLYADSRRSPMAFDSADLEFLAAFTSQAAVALENAELLRTVQREAAIRQNLQRFFPPAVAELVAREPLSPREVVVTAMFADISGYTQLAASLAPLEVIALLNDVFPEIARIVFAHGGVIEKYIGDCIVAIWGAPAPEPGDPERAVAAALALIDAIDARNRSDSRVGPAVRFHVGLHTGPVALGNIGSDSYLQLAAIGDATNIAARVCEAAGPMELVCTAETFSALRAPPPFTVREEVTLKGRGARTLYVLRSAASRDG